MKTEIISRRVLSLLMCIVILIPNISSFAIAYDDEKVIFNKRESVYVNSDAYGKPTIVNIYNDFDIANVSEITDYGNYNKFQVLTGKNTPNVSGDTITWNVNKEDRKFGYIGTSSLDYISNIPWTFEIKYYLNGKEALANDLIHQKGLVKVEVHAIPNDKAPDYYKNNYMMEIQCSFDMTEYISVSSNDAIESIVGNTKTLTFMILPGQDKVVSFEVGSDDFYMNGITIGMVPLVGDIQEVIQDLVDDRKKIKEAFKEMNSSFDVILNNFSKSGKDTDEVIASISKLEDSLAVLNNGKSQRSDDIVALQGAISTLSGDFANISNTINECINDISYTRDKVKEFKEFMSIVNGDLKELSKNLAENEKDLDRISKEVKGLDKDIDSFQQVVISTKNSIGGLNKLLGNLDEVSDIDISAVEKGLTSIGADAQSLGAVAQEIAATDPASAMEVGRIASDIGNNLKKVSSEMEKAQDLMGDTNKNTTSLSKSLKDLQADLIDLSESIGGFEEDSKKLPDTIKNLNASLKTANSLIDDITSQIDSNLSDDTAYVNEQIDNLENLLINLSSIINDINMLTSVTNDVLSTTNNDLNIVSNNVHDSAMASLESTKSLLTTLKGVTSQSIPLKNAKNKLYDTIKEETDDIENKTNIFNMDPDAEPVSFVSDKNENVEKVQIFVQTEAIKEYNFKDTEDIEPKKEKLTFWEKILQVLNIIADFFKGLFRK